MTGRSQGAGSRATGEKVTGRNARGLQMEEIGCKCQTFFYLSLKQQEETNYECQIFFPPSLYKIKRRFLLKFCVARQHLAPPELNFSQTLS